MAKAGFRTAEMAVQIARGYIGYKEKASNSNLYEFTSNAGSNNYTMFAQLLYEAGYYGGYNKNGYPWCEVFVDYCIFMLCDRDKDAAMSMQYTTPLDIYGAGCAESYMYYKNAGMIYSEPKVGDQIYFYWGGEIAHTGIVSKVEGNIVWTIEGNSNNMVEECHYYINDSLIYGYGRINYDSGSEVSSSQESTSSSEQSQVSKTEEVAATSSSKSNSGTLYTTSGNNSSDSSKYRRIKFDWSSTNNDSDNTSTIKWTASIVPGKNSSGATITPSGFSYCYNININIDGNDVYTQPSYGGILSYGGKSGYTDKHESISGRSELGKISGTITVKHNDDGSRSVPIKITGLQYYSNECGHPFYWKDKNNTVVFYDGYKGYESSKEVKSVQKEVSNLGYDPGTIDGIYGSNTANAVLRFQTARGMNGPDGMVGKNTRLEFKNASLPDNNMNLGMSSNVYINLPQNKIYSLYAKEDAGSTVRVVGSSGNISTGSNALLSGEEIKIYVDPKDGYNVSNIMVNGAKYSEGTIYKVSGDVSISYSTSVAGSTIKCYAWNKTSGSKASNGVIYSESNTNALRVVVTRPSKTSVEKIYIKHGNSKIQDITGSSGGSKSSYVYVIKNIDSLCKKSSSASCKVVCETYEDGELVGDVSTCDIDIYLDPSKYSPIIYSGDVSMKTGSNTAAITGNNKTIMSTIRDSEIYVNVHVKPSGTNAPSVSKNNVKLNGVSAYSVSSKKTDSNGDYYTALFKGNSIPDSVYNCDAIGIVVTDGRNNYSSSVTYDNGIYDLGMSYIDYVQPTITPSVSRNAGNDGISISFTGNFYNGNIGSTQNHVFVSYKYRETESTDWSDEIVIDSSKIATKSGYNLFSSSYNLYVMDGGDIATFDHSSAYTFVFYVKDSINSASSATASVIRAIPVFDWGRDDVSFNKKVYIKDGAEISGDVKVNGAMTFESGSSVSGNTSFSDSIIVSGDVASSNSISSYGFTSFKMSGIQLDSQKSVLYYKKYYNGMASIWGSIYVKPTGNNGGSGGVSGNLYYSDLIEVNTPFPVYNAVITGNSNYCSYVANCGYSSRESNISFRIVRPAPIVGGGSMDDDIYHVYINIMCTTKEDMESHDCIEISQ